MRSKAEIAAYLKEFERKRKVLGICNKCNSPVWRPGARFCLKHFTVAAARLRKLRDDRRKRFLCAQCGKRKSPPGSNCSQCNKMMCLYVAGYRKKVLDHYGHKCACCGITGDVFLTIDHINNDGAEHRKTVPKSSLYRWLIRNGFPKQFQTLCWNCNSAKHLLGKCPHKSK